MVYLKTVEATGFKSFADKTTVMFDEGVTAIIGPNGSGKSNITDAIKWVLGEQSAKSLRGGKMEDIIFSGAKDRNATNYAEVTLTIDNHERKLSIDADIVAITRKLYRSGDSEYLVNKHKVRLKDITELFLDSGLGRDAFSIISQGKVDQVLNAKPIERRQLIEEAAGVLKYKKRKVETEHKLEDTMNNLNRVHDIIFDLKDRVEPLKIEASIAEEYIALSDEMKDADIQVTVHDIKTNNEQYQQIQNDIQSFEAQKEFKLNKNERLNEQLIAKKQLLTEETKSLESDKSNLLQITEQIERNIGLLNVNKERLNHQTSNIEEKHKLQSKMNDDIKRLKMSSDTHVTKIKALKNERVKLKDKLSETEQSKTALEEDIDTLIEETRSEYYEQYTLKTKLENDIQHMRSRIDAFNDDKAVAVHDQVKAEYASLLEKHQSIISKINETEQHVQQKRAEYAEQQQHIQQKKQTYFKDNEQLKQAEQHLSSLEHKLNRLKMMQEEFQGYYQGVRLLLKNKQQLKGIHHTILDLISIDAQYNDALDSALGGILQHIVVDDARAAQSAIEFLKSKKAGRATFLPLNIIKPRNIQQNLLAGLQQFEGFIGTLSQLIHVDAAYKHIIDNVAGHIIIATNLTEANKIAKFAEYRHKVVTLDGQVVNTGGSMTGGSKQKPTQALTSRNELNQLTAQYETFKAQTNELKEKVVALNESIAEEEFQLEQDKQEGISLRDVLHQDKLLKEELNAKLERLQSQIDRSEQYEKARNEVAQLKLDKKECEQQVSEIESKLSALTDKIKMYQDSASNKKSLSDAIQIELQQLHKSITQLDADIQYEMKLQKDVTQQIEELNEALSQIITDTNLFDPEAIQTEIAQLQHNIDSDNTRKTDIINSIAQYNSNIETLNESIASLESDIRAITLEINGLVNGIGELKSQYSRLDVLIDNLIEHMNFTYEMTYEAAEKYMDDHQLKVRDDSHLNELRSRVKLTKIAIDELGSVNMNAIEQYAAVSERYEFLQSQEADLLEAKDNLESIIEDMDKTVAARFKATFDIVSQAFEQIFKQLFGGGEGRLILTENDYLNSGIDIFVQPPGKKRQHLSLLSGGERAMTAIVLLFAILNAKRAPFVILDEVEAALDEANVSRFAQYLTTLKEQTQFIVITHRKGTMEESDRLYGVTMQNSGISKLVSVNLKEIDDKKFKELTK